MSEHDDTPDAPNWFDSRRRADEADEPAVEAVADTDSETITLVSRRLEAVETRAWLTAKADHVLDLTEMQ